MLIPHLINRLRCKRTVLRSKLGVFLLRIESPNPPDRAQGQGSTDTRHASRDRQSLAVVRRINVRLVADDGEQLRAHIRQRDGGGTVAVTREVHCDPDKDQHDARVQCGSEQTCACETNRLVCEGEEHDESHEAEGAVGSDEETTASGAVGDLRAEHDVDKGACIDDGGHELCLFTFPAETVEDGRKEVAQTGSGEVNAAVHDGQCPEERAGEDFEQCLETSVKPTKLAYSRKSSYSLP